MAFDELDDILGDHEPSTVVCWLRALLKGKEEVWEMKSLLRAQSDVPFKVTNHITGHFCSSVPSKYVRIMYLRICHCVILAINLHNSLHPFAHGGWISSSLPRHIGICLKFVEKEKCC